MGISTLTGEVRKILAQLMQIDQVRGLRPRRLGRAAAVARRHPGGPRRWHLQACPCSVAARPTPPHPLTPPTPCMQDYYPELMWKCYIINAPTTFR